MPFYVYIIGTKEPKKRTYVGWTNNIKKRLELHNTSKGATIEEIIIRPQLGDI